ncbi:MAG: NAD-dependent epimerase/dehydratase family protein [Candidatus Zixiibacteriota bacterium]|nr:MAG: NAD-dependent epimerase/dehydratase family protein [candidate division Zixibacteria bacterium]
MKVAVTGAGGFLGQALVYELLESKHEPVAIIKRESDADEFDDSSLKIICQDLSDKEGCAGIFKDCDAVVHCAALRRDFGSRKEFQKMNVETTRNVMESALKDGVSRVIHISSTAVYGNERNHVVTGEDADYGERIVDLYTRTKIEGEKIVMRMVEHDGLPAIILRPGQIWGPGDRRILPFIVNGLKSKRLVLVNEGGNFLSLSFIDNVIEAIKLAIEKEKAVGETYNITDGLKVTSKRFISDIIAALGIDYKIRNGAYPFLYGVASLTEWYFRLVRRKSRPPFTRYMARFLRYDSFFDISKAIDELGYVPRISYKEGITLVTPYLRSLYYGRK